MRKHHPTKIAITPRRATATEESELHFAMDRFLEMFVRQELQRSVPNTDMCVSIAENETKALKSEEERREPER
jgi:hypothetical protein